VAKKEVKPWTLGDLGSGIGQGYEWLKTHTLTGGTPAKDPTNVSSHPGADKLFDPPKLTSDDKRSTTRKIIDEFSGSTVGGNSFRYKKKAPAGGTNPPKGGGGRWRSEGRNRGLPAARRAELARRRRSRPGALRPRHQAELHQEAAVAGRPRHQGPEVVPRQG
jgi:hypothetical protein